MQTHTGNVLHIVSCLATLTEGNAKHLLLAVVQLESEQNEDLTGYSTSWCHVSCMFTRLLTAQTYICYGIGGMQAATRFRTT